jgi:Prokaryotic homologs of the JAB domain
MPLRLSEGLLREALGTLRHCSAGVRECVCWLTGPIDEPGVLDDVLHPSHSASAGGYRVEDRWINDAWLALARAGREVRLQVHTHPGAAYHSATDDAYPAVQTPGFLSLVIPRFAQDADGLAGAHLAELTGAGEWRSVEPAERLLIT